MASKLLINATIITVDPHTSSVSVLHDSHLLINGDTITHISPELSSIPKDGGTETVDCSGKILCPGFIDTHRHLFQTAFRTLGPNTTLAEYFFKHSPMSASNNAWTSEDIYISTLFGYADALNSGVTTLLDHAHNHWSREVMRAGFRGAVDSGARAFWCYDPTGAGSDGWGYDEQVAEIKSAKQTLTSSPTDALVTVGLAFDGLERSDEDRVKQIKSLIQTLDIPVMTIHYLGGPWPAGANSPSLADKHGLLDTSTAVVFSHGGFIPPHPDIPLLRSKNHYLSITPESEMHYGHGQRTSRTVPDHSSLGIDTAWTFSGDILTQARLYLQSNRLERYEDVLVTQKRIPRTSPMDVNATFLLATRQGGRALRRADLGVLRVGAKADLCIFDGESVNMLGWRDAVAAIILHANVGDIEGVIVGGEWRKRDGELVGTFGGMEWKELKEEFRKTAGRVQDKMESIQVSMPETFLGTEFGEVEKVVV